MKHLKLSTLIFVKFAFVTLFTLIYWAFFPRNNLVLALAIFAVATPIIYLYLVDFILKILELEK